MTRGILVRNGGRRGGRGVSRLRLLAVASAAVALPLTAALPAFAGTAAHGATAGTAGHTATAESDTGTGTVTQMGGIPTMTGGASWVNTEFKAELPAGVHGPVTAVVAFDSGQLPGAGWYSERVAPHLHAQCAVGGGAYQDCQWLGNTHNEQPLDGYLHLPLPTTDAAQEIDYHVRISADRSALPDDLRLTGWAKVFDADGNAVADGLAQIQYRQDNRGQFYARDAAGVLWRYEGVNHAQYAPSPFLPRVRVGGGWNAYDAITPLISTTATGLGDIVARDRSGVLWYYQASGDPAQPWKPRVRVGGGWQVYTALAGTGGNMSELGHRTGDLVAQDRDGILWYYKATGNPQTPFAPREAVGHGWKYTQLTTFGNGIMARDSDGVLWSYGRAAGYNGSNPLWPRDRVGGGWNTYRLTAGTWDDDWAYPAALLGLDTAGKLWMYPQPWFDPGLSPRRLVGGGWQVYTKIF